MPRPRAFDETAALRAALDLFWSQGFAATSLRDLQDAMGLSSASLYNAFGDKQALFRRCLDHYLDQSMRARISVCDTLPPREAIVAFLAGIVARSLEDARGCLMVNTAVELAPHDPAIAAVIAERLGELEAFFLRSLRRGQRDGSISGQVQAPDVARLLVASVLGLRVLGRTRPDPALLQGVARQAIALLEPDGAGVVEARSTQPIG